MGTQLNIGQTNDYLLIHSYSPLSRLWTSVNLFFEFWACVCILKKNNNTDELESLYNTITNMIVSFKTNLSKSFSPMKPILTIYIIYCSPPVFQILDGMFCHQGVGKDASGVPKTPISEWC